MSEPDGRWGTLKTAIREARVLHDAVWERSTFPWWKGVAAVTPAFICGALGDIPDPLPEAGVRLAATSWLVILVARTWSGWTPWAAMACGLMGFHTLGGYGLGPAFAAPLASLAAAAALGIAPAPPPLRHRVVASRVLVPLVAATSVVAVSYQAVRLRLGPSHQYLLVAATTWALVAGLVVITIAPTPFDWAVSRWGALWAPLRRSWSGRREGFLARRPLRVRIPRGPRVPAGVAARFRSLLVVVGWTDPPSGRWSRGVLRFRFPVLVWLLFAVPINAYVFHVFDGPGPFFDLDRLATNRQSWDWHLYYDVIQRGYLPHRGLEAIFPGIPLLARAARPWIDPTAAAVLVSIVGGLVATVALHVWTGVKGLAPVVRRLTVLLFLVQPFGFQLAGIPYPDAATTACVIVACVLAERRRLVAAGVVGAIATVLRPNALPLIPTLVLFGLLQGGVLRFPTPGGAHEGDRVRFTEILRPFNPAKIEWRRIRPRQFGGALSLLGVGAFSLWLWRDRGEPFAFWTVQKEFYGHAPMTQLSSWLRLDFLEQGGVGALVRSPPWLLFGELGALLMTVLALGTVTRVAARYGLPYAVLNLALVATFFGGADSFLTPGGRLLLPAFTIAPVLAQWLDRRRWLVVPVLVAALVIGIGHAVGFAKGACCW